MCIVHRLCVLATTPLTLAEGHFLLQCIICNLIDASLNIVHSQDESVELTSDQAGQESALSISSQNDITSIVINSICQCVAIYHHSSQ